MVFPKKNFLQLVMMFFMLLKLAKLSMGHHTFDERFHDPQRYGEPPRMMDAGNYGAVYLAKDCALPQCSKYTFIWAPTVVIKLLWDAQKSRHVHESEADNWWTLFLELRAYMWIPEPHRSHLVEIRGILFSTSNDSPPSCSSCIYASTNELEHSDDVAIRRFRRSPNELVSRLRGLVYEFCSGDSWFELAETVADLLEDDDGVHGPSLRTSLEYLDQALTTMQILHDHEIVHYDIKADNTFICNHGAKVADMGFAQIFPIDTLKNLHDYIEGVWEDHADLGIAFFAAVFGVRPESTEGQVWHELYSECIELMPDRRRKLCRDTSLISDTTYLGVLPVLPEEEFSHVHIQYYLADILRQLIFGGPKHVNLVKQHIYRMIECDAYQSNLPTRSMVLQSEVQYFGPDDHWQQRNEDNIVTAVLDSNGLSVHYDDSAASDSMLKVASIPLHNVPCGHIRSCIHRFNRNNSRRFSLCLEVEAGSKHELYSMCFENALDRLEWENQLHKWGKCPIQIFTEHALEHLNNWKWIH